MQGSGKSAYDIWGVKKNDAQSSNNQQSQNQGYQNFQGGQNQANRVPFKQNTGYPQQQQMKNKNYQSNYSQQTPHNYPTNVQSVPQNKQSWNYPSNNQFETQPQRVQNKVRLHICYLSLRTFCQKIELLLTILTNQILLLSRTILPSTGNQATTTATTITARSNSTYRTRIKDTIHTLLKLTLQCI